MRAYRILVRYARKSQGLTFGLAMHRFMTPDDVKQCFMRWAWSKQYATSSAVITHNAIGSLVLVFELGKYSLMLPPQLSVAGDGLALHEQHATVHRLRGTWQRAIVTSLHSILHNR